MKQPQKSQKAFFLAFVFAVFIFYGQTIHAATLYFSPSAGNFTVGNIFTVGLLVNTQGQVINNTEAVLNFPADFMEVTSVSKFGSIFSLWVEEPNFSNNAGIISFNGGIPTPGFIGSNGKIINVVFRVKKAGLGSLISTSAAVRANDGYGTDILVGTPQASFTLITEEAPAPPATEKPVSGAPTAPKISSPTHPDPDKWYAEKIATFNWPTGADVTATRLLVGKIATANPIVLYIPAVSTKTVGDFEEGVWYFSAQLRNNAGWGTIGRFRLRVDTENPDHFDIRLASQEDLTEPRVKFIFEASDRTSGIDHYEVRIDNRASDIWRDDGTKTYQTPILEPGLHTITAKAVDKAGNELQNSIQFNIEALTPPIISEYPREVQGDDFLVIRGSTYPDSLVTVFFQGPDTLNFNIRSDHDGIFTFVSDDRLKDGVYKIWAETKDSRGAKSAPSNEVTIIVRPPTLIRIGSFAVSLLSTLIPLIALLALLVFMIVYAKYKFTQLKKHLRKEVREAEDALHKAFDLLKEDMREQIKMLEKARTKRQLTEEEDKIIKQIKNDLDDAEKFVKKEIEDVEKLVK